MKSSFVQENFRTLVLAILFFVVIFQKSLSTRPHATNLDNLTALIPFPASQVEALDVEVFSNSQGSRIVSMKDSSIAFLSRSVLITFKYSESSKEVNPGSIEAFATLPFVAIASVKRCTLSFSHVSSHHDQFFRPLDLIRVSVTTVRRHDVTPPSFSTTVLATLRPHEPTIVVTPSFKGKTECIDHVCARIKLHTRLDIMNTKNSATRIKSYYKP
jgi:hypothetical protein